MDVTSCGSEDKSAARTGRAKRETKGKKKKIKRRNEKEEKKKCQI